MAVVADVYADRGVARLEHGIAQVAGLEEVLLPRTRRVGDVVLAVLAEVAAIGVDHRGAVVVHTGHLAFVHRYDDHHVVLLCELLHPLDGRAGDRLGGVIPLCVLAGTEVRAVEDLLEAEDLHALFARLLR